MTINNFIVLMLFILMFMFITVSSIDTITPFYKNADFKSICEEYNQIIIKDGMLNSSQITELRAKLEDKNITITTMNLPTSAVWGDSFTFEIEATYSIKVLKVNFTKELKTYNFRYKKTGVALKGGD